MAEEPQGCARLTGSVVGEEAASPPSAETLTEKKEVNVAARVGQKAPDFTAPAYYRGGFTNVKLSDFLAKGKWVLLCFYPGDFTFV